jgi:hypothetical protein
MMLMLREERELECSVINFAEIFDEKRVWCSLS